MYLKQFCHESFELLSSPSPKSSSPRTKTNPIAVQNQNPSPIWSDPTLKSHGPPPHQQLLTKKECFKEKVLREKVSE